MGISTVNSHINNWQFNITGSQLCVKHEATAFTLLFFFICFCCFTNLSAQDSLATFKLTAGSFPADLDSMQVDSFFATKGVALSQALRPLLYAEIYRWYGTCYRYGGNSQQGVDCSHFVNMLYERVYDRKLEGGSATIFTQCKPVKGGVTSVQEGDLIFFRIKKKRISHIGIYLQNGKFAHASTQSGVVISDLSERYYEKYFYKVAVPE